MHTRWWLAGLVLAIGGSAGPACEEKGEPEPTASPAPVKAAEPTVEVGTKGVRPKVMRDGVPGRVVDMRVRADVVMEDVQPGPDGWKTGGDWRVFELAYRDGALKAELAVQVPAAHGAGPVAGRGRLRLLSGDAGPFLHALRFVLGARAPAGSGQPRTPVTFELQVLTTQGQDTGKADFEAAGGQWIICRAVAPGPEKAAFDLRFFPPRGLLRIVPVPGQAIEPVLALFSSALR